MLYALPMSTCYLQTEPLPISVPQGEGEWLEHTAQQAHKLFGMMKGGAENLFKNIKDTSSKVMHTVAGLVSYVLYMIVQLSYSYSTGLTDFLIFRQA